MSHTAEQIADWDENTNTRVWAEIIFISYFTTDIAASGAYITARSTLAAAQNSAPDGVTVTGDVWRNGNIISSWTRTSGRFNAGDIL